MHEQMPMNLGAWVGYFETGGLVSLLFVLASELFLRWNEGKGVLPRDGFANFCLFFFGPVLEAVVGNAILLAGLFFVHELTPLRIPVTPWMLVIYFLAGELCFYWFHRISHEVRLFWADHSIHHSSPELDFTINLRHTPFSTVYRLLTWAPWSRSASTPPCSRRSRSRRRRSRPSATPRASAASRRGSSAGS
jgi:sterol desaturase/sphingolipid hydroxylase (fatty acid hydroxylase superfamily)